MGIIQNIDNNVLEAINIGLSNTFFDIVIPWFRNKYFWIPLYVFLIVYSILKFQKHAYIIIVTALLTIVVADQLSSSIMKPLFQRVRPCNNIELVDLHVLAPCRNSYSFPSSHATNHFAIAVFFILLFKSWKKRHKGILIVWASIICFAQMYVGLHYFTDVLVGGFLGYLIALLMYYFLQKYYLRNMNIV